MKNNSDNGFSLVELVVVILVLSVLAVSVIPRIPATSDYQISADRDQTLALLRTVQARAMYNTELTNSGSKNQCYGVGFAGDEIGMLGQNANGTCSSGFIVVSNDVQDYLRFQTDSAFVVTNSANVQVSSFSFNNLGQPIPQTGYRITFASSLSVCVETEGYIHAC